MRVIKEIVKKYPLSCACIALIWVLCFIPVPDLHLDHVTLLDKWVHALMYAGTCAVIWMEYLRRHTKKANKRRLLLFAWLAPVLMSGVIEVLQEYCTFGIRGGDWRDLVANTTGAILSLCGGMLYLWFRARE